MCQTYISTSHATMQAAGLANGPSRRSIVDSRRVAGRMITRDSPSRISSGAMSPSRTCWTMCAENR